MANSEEIGCGAAFVVIAVIGLIAYDHHVETTKAAAEAQAEARVKADAKHQEEAATTLAKNAHTLSEGSLSVRKPDPEVLTNDYQLRELLSKMKGDLKVLGWDARKFDDDTYVVSFSYQRSGTTRGWPFEVNVRAGVVRRIVGDAELEKKYGWANSE